MSLYLRSDVEKLALATWKSAENLFLEKERRTEERLRRSAAKKRATSGTPEERIAALCGGDVRGGKKKPLVSGLSKARPIGEPAHQHVFLPDETYDEEADEWTKRCECGFTVTYERI
jgi:hypothetical protein